MRRWNGWGDSETTYPLPAAAGAFLQQAVGVGVPPADVPLAEAVGSVPASNLPDHPLIDKDRHQRLLHARGQSLPDWIALRSGEIGTFPDGVAFPSSDGEVRELIRFAAQTGVRLIPYGGGTSVAGHVNPIGGGAPVLTVDLRHLSRMRLLDERSRLATFGAGIVGPDLESHLRTHGYTLGHFPQSFELSTLGGWIATRSCGQQSLGYGRIEDLFAGGTVVAPEGELKLPAFPASAAGPDLRHLVLGSEGRLGIVTEATVRVSPLPEDESFHAVFFPSWDDGVEAVREISQQGLPVSMLRLSTPMETKTTLVLAGHERAIGTLERFLSWRGVGSGKSMLLIGCTGGRSTVRSTRRAALAIARRHGGVHVGKSFGERWRRSRFRAPYLRNTLWEAGYAVDTLETATTWDRMRETLAAVEGALHEALAGSGERIHLFSHMSHAYPSGSSLYTTFLFRLSADAEENLERWRRLKVAASEAIVTSGATISHQHGVGVDHAKYLAAEKGELGLELLRGTVGRLDPDGLMNPGKMLATEMSSGVE